MAMYADSDVNTLTKTFYRPIEAAIRWSNLSQFETQIIKQVGDVFPLSAFHFSEWPILHLNAERIFDALVNGELKYSKLGVVCPEPLALNDPTLTIRHVDLRRWMVQHYPAQRPAFLFDTLERQLHPAVTIEAVQTLLAELELWRGKSQHAQQIISALQQENQLLTKRYAILDKQFHSDAAGQRSKNTYLHIIGSLVNLLLGQSPAGKPYSVFKTQEAIISALVAHHGEKLGISKTTLENKFAEAKRRLLSQ